MKNGGEGGGVVVVEAVGEAEAGTHGGGEHAAASGGADEGEGGDVEADGAGVGALVDDDVDDEVFHGGVEVLFYGALHAVDFVDEENVAAFETGEKAGEVGGFVDDGAGSAFDVDAHGVGEDVGEGCFAEAGGPGEEDVVEDIAAFFGGLNEEFEAFTDFILSGEVGEAGGTERLFEFGVGRDDLAFHGDMKP